MTSLQPLASFKAQFQSSSGLTHLNNAGQAPLCQVAADDQIRWARILHEQGGHCYPQLAAETEAARGHLAAFLGCSVHELCYFSSTAGAVSQVALGLDLKAGDEIVIWEQEYPSNFYPWIEAAKRSGARVVVVNSEADSSVSLSSLQKALTAKTRVIATSWVQFRTGSICDLRELAQLARPRGIFTSVDVIQGAGCLPFHFHELQLDAVCGGSHKWLGAGHGAGFLALREENIERLRPIMVGAMTYGGPDVPVDFNAKAISGAARFEPGGKANSVIIGLGSAAKMYASVGMDVIAQEAEWLARKLLHGLRELGYRVSSPHGTHHRGSIINFTPGSDSPLSSIDEIAAQLSRAQISFARRPPGVRFSPHAFNTAEDIERTVQVLSLPLQKS